jgi:hypothetical protein
MKWWLKEDWQCQLNKNGWKEVFNLGTEDERFFVNRLFGVCLMQNFVILAETCREIERDRETDRDREREVQERHSG